MMGAFVCSPAVNAATLVDEGVVLPWTVGSGGPVQVHPPAACAMAITGGTQAEVRAERFGVLLFVRLCHRDTGRWHDRCVVAGVCGTSPGSSRSPAIAPEWAVAWQRCSSVSGLRRRGLPLRVVASVLDEMGCRAACLRRVLRAHG